MPTFWRPWRSSPCVASRHPSPPDGAGEPVPGLCVISQNLPGLPRSYDVLSRGEGKAPGVIEVLAGNDGQPSIAKKPLTA